MSDNAIAALVWLGILSFVAYKISKKARSTGGTVTELLGNAIGWVLCKVIDAGTAIVLFVLPAVAAILVLWGFIRLIRWMWDTAIF